MKPSILFMCIFSLGTFLNGGDSPQEKEEVANLNQRIAKIELQLSKLKSARLKLLAEKAKNSTKVKQNLEKMADLARDFQRLQQKLNSSGKVKIQPTYADLLDRTAQQQAIISELNQRLKRIRKLGLQGTSEDMAAKIRAYSLVENAFSKLIKQEKNKNVKNYLQILLESLRTRKNSENAKSAVFDRYLGRIIYNDSKSTAPNDPLDPKVMKKRMESFENAIKARERAMEFLKALSIEPGSSGRPSTNQSDPLKNLDKMND